MQKLNANCFKIEYANFLTPHNKAVRRLFKAAAERYMKDVALCHNDALFVE